MSNYYYGDGGVSTVTGNWNSTSNWFISLGVCCCGSSSPGTHASNVPGPTDTAIITNNHTGGQIIITTGPTNFAGTVKTIALNQLGQTWVNITTGTYSGVWDMTAGPVFGFQISGGSFTGSFKGYLTNGFTISGGNFSPTVTLSQSSGTITMTNTQGQSIQDFGFAYGYNSGSSTSTYTPIINISNLPTSSNILGAGMP